MMSTRKGLCFHRGDKKKAISIYSALSIEIPNHCLTRLDLLVGHLGYLTRLVKTLVKTRLD